MHPLFFLIIYNPLLLSYDPSALCTKYTLHTIHTSVDLGSNPLYVIYFLLLLAHNVLFLSDFFFFFFRVGYIVWAKHKKKEWQVGTPRKHERKRSGRNKRCKIMRRKMPAVQKVMYTLDCKRKESNGERDRETEGKCYKERNGGRLCIR